LGIQQQREVLEVRAVSEAREQTLFSPEAHSPCRRFPKKHKQEVDRDGRSFLIELQTDLLALDEFRVELPRLMSKKVAPAPLGDRFQECPPQRTSPASRAQGQGIAVIDLFT